VLNGSRPPEVYGSRLHSVAEKVLCYANDPCSIRGVPSLFAKLSPLLEGSKHQHVPSGSRHWKAGAFWYVLRYAAKVPYCSLKTLGYNESSRALGLVVRRSQRIFSCRGRLHLIVRRKSLQSRHYRVLLDCSRRLVLARDPRSNRGVPSLLFLLHMVGLSAGRSRQIHAATQDFFHRSSHSVGSTPHLISCHRTQAREANTSEALGPVVRHSQQFDGQRNSLVQVLDRAW
jgi:hypothetical protein